MALRSAKWVIWVLIAFCALGVTAAARAGWLGAGCWVCEYVGLLGPSERCFLVGSNEHGDGINCYEAYLFGWYCETSGGPCFNVDAIEDPPDGGGGGGGCTIVPGEACPADCPSCDTDPFKY